MINVSKSQALSNLETLKNELRFEEDKTKILNHAIRFRDLLTEWNTNVDRVISIHIIMYLGGKDIIDKITSERVIQYIDDANQQIRSSAKFPE